MPANSTQPIILSHASIAPPERIPACGCCGGAHGGSSGGSLPYDAEGEGAGIYQIGRYRAPWWLRNRHAQTIVPSLLPWPWIRYTRERWPTPDGRDFIDVDWAGGEGATPVLVLFHGLEGDSCGS